MEEFVVCQPNKAAQSCCDVKVEDFSIGVRGMPLISNARLQLSYGRRYGLVGCNGSGKTTLLNHIARGGLNLGLPDSAKVLLCEQEVEASNDTPLEVVLASNRQYALLQQRLATATDDDSLLAVYQELEAMDADQLKPRATQILAGLGFTPASLAKPVAQLSGGWRMRVSLARALFLEPHLAKFKPQHICWGLYRVVSGLNVGKYYASIANAPARVKRRQLCCIASGFKYGFKPKVCFKRLKPFQNLCFKLLKSQQVV